MKQPSETIVFFGSGPVAAASLLQLREFINIEAVITRPQAAHGHRASPPVKQLAQEHNLMLYEPQSRRELSDLFEKTEFSSRLGVVVDYGIIIAQTVLDSFEKGIINSHFSLLPQWRGADPITFSILSGQPETGVSLMVINDKMDEGDLLAQENIHIPSDWTTQDLTNELVKLSGSMLERYVPLYLSGILLPFPQDNPAAATYSRKLTKQDGTMDFTKPAAVLAREVRAYSGWPKSSTAIGTLEVVITSAHAATLPELSAWQKAGPGEIITQGNCLAIGTADGLLVIDTLKPAGKNTMTSAAFLAGYSKYIIQ